MNLLEDHLDLWKDHSEVRMHFLFRFYSDLGNGSTSGFDLSVLQTTIFKVSFEEHWSAFQCKTSPRFTNRLQRSCFLSSRFNSCCFSWL